MSVVTEMHWNFSVVLICISFMVKDIEYFFMYRLVVYTSSTEHCVFNSFVDLFIGLFVLLVFYLFVLQYWS
jgi:hypothetical protein